MQNTAFIWDAKAWDSRNWVDLSLCVCAQASAYGKSSLINKIKQFIHHSRKRAWGKRLLLNNHLKLHLTVNFIHKINTIEFFYTVGTQSVDDRVFAFDFCVFHQILSVQHCYCYPTIANQLLFVGYCWATLQERKKPFHLAHRRVIIYFNRFFFVS